MKCLELQRAIAELHFEAGPGHILELSGSFGIASYPSDGDTYEALLAQADRRMSEDKERHRLAQNAASTADGSTAVVGLPFAKIGLPASSHRSH